MSATTKPTMDRKKLIHTIIVLALMFLFRFLPPIGSITKDGMAVLGIFFGCIYAWTVGEVFWPSVLALFNKSCWLFTIPTPATITIRMITHKSCQFPNLRQRVLSFLCRISYSPALPGRAYLSD